MEKEEFVEEETVINSNAQVGKDALSTEPALTPTVSSSIEQLQSMGENVSAVAFAQEVLKRLSDYAGGRATSELKETPSKRPAPEWVAEIRPLFDWNRIQELSKSDRPPVLHGRIVVVGLCLLEPKLRSQLETTGVFSDLIYGLKEQPFKEILTERGYHLWAGYTSEPSDTVASWPDDPLKESEAEDDLLGRNAFARFLDQRIRAVSSESGAYAIHIYGPWGAGKTSLLNLLKRQLEMKDAEKERNQQNGKEEKRNWQIVEYNAWRNQHIQPPWWSLMEQVFTTTKKSLSLWNRFREYWWRFSTGRLPYIVGLIVFVWLLALIVFPFLRNQASDNSKLEYLAVSADNISKIVALLATIWGVILAVNRSLLVGTAQAAKRYSELTHDPTSAIKQRFADLIDRAPNRIAVFIDDLDRCQSQYVVDLLEGIQTLFREAPVVFVVAADRQWLNGCYEDVYEKLKPRIHEPGKPLGTLFLEKAFQFATPMPGIPNQLKESFWEHLLNLKPAEWKAQIAAARETARSRLAEAGGEEEIRQLVTDQGERSFPEQRAFREEAVVRLAAPEVVVRLEHTLQLYLGLLEPNPRAMKLLVNAYSANRALAMLSEVDIDRHQLALWTILGARWPQLAEHLLKTPTLLNKLESEDSSDVPDDVKNLFTVPGIDQVMQVVRGDGNGTELTIETIRQCVRMRF